MILIVKLLNFYSFNHKFKLNKIFKIMNTLQTDFLIIRKSTKNLFKINMIKKNKKIIFQHLIEFWRKQKQFVIEKKN